MSTYSGARMFTWKLSRFIWLMFGVLEAVIGLRVVLRLIAANPSNPFAIVVYRLSYLFLWPFLGLTRTPSLNGSVLELSSLIAMFVYAVLAWVIVQLVWILFDRPPRPTVVRESTIVDQTGRTQPNNPHRV